MGWKFSPVIVGYEDDKCSESDGLISRYNFAVKLKKYIYIYKDKAANCV